MHARHAPMTVRLLVAAAALLWAVLLPAGSRAAGEQAETTLDAGAGTAAAGPYRLDYSIGQVDTGRTAAGGYRLDYGFWRPAGADPGAIFSDGFESTETTP